MDLFEPIVPEESYDPNFKIVLEDSQYYLSARKMINEVYNSWDGWDNHFINEFQATNFNARLWELYLYILFISLGYEVDKCEEDRPDFRITKGKQVIFVEAVTSNPSHTSVEQRTLVTFSEEDANISLLKIRNALKNKVKKKKYWELDWVKGHPFIIAIAPFHSSEALNITDFFLVKYLYGVTINRFYEGNDVKITESKVQIHQLYNQEIPNFFESPGSENISAVLYSNSATVGKFSRMGYLKGYGKENTTNFFYSGSCYNHDKNSLGLTQFLFDLKRDPDAIDDWRFGTSISYNHNAQVPLSFDFFDNMTQYMYDNDAGFFRKMLSFHPYNAKNLRSFNS